MTSNIQMVQIQPQDYLKGPTLHLDYCSLSTKFGDCLVALSGDQTVYYAAFYDRQEMAQRLEQLRRSWPGAQLRHDQSLGETVADWFEDTSTVECVKVAVKGTEFQLRVWRALLDIAAGTTVSYETVAHRVGRPKAVRAAASAVAANPVAYLIPCHRVITKDGRLGDYASGARRKFHMLQTEGVHRSH